MDPDDEWEAFQENENCMVETPDTPSQTTIDDIIIPKPSDIYVSTTTKIAYFNKEIDINKLFWLICVVPYQEQQEGIIKKQMKIISTSKKEFDEIENKLKDITDIYYSKNTISDIDNQIGTIRYKNIQKISIGISKKDLLSYRKKTKSAFYNCFVLIMRIKFNSLYREFHIKIFNTGKIEIPGIQNDENFTKILDYLTIIINKYNETDIYINRENQQQVLINSNFNCNFYINRETLYTLLKEKYGLNTIFDPCSYPGIQSKFYFKNNSLTQNGKFIEDAENIISFMIFRTGSVLIVGKCDTNILNIIYKFINIVLQKEYINIVENVDTRPEIKTKIKKPFTKKITFCY